ncbi:hypothetical protein CPB83DRAFT_594143 [Crepidotus variabilis]|uniref:F-box domain-containing protein n=1 Tax=Crepidotus variabilis TaxID=179855 RepID=A0A9P6E938_9AGAR|nr:hypothetical protein CPB83DRAFT_594143 [Crepidotus variabilis]
MLCLPPELLTLIFEHLIEDLQTLRSLCCTARHIRPEAERLLYRNPLAIARSTSKPSSRIVLSTKRQIQFLTTIVETSRLAKLVHAFNCDSLVEDNEHAPYDLVKSALKEMVNLKSLIFRTFSGTPAVEILAECSFQLEELNWQPVGEDEQAFEKWLQGQKELRKLAVWLGTKPEDNTSASVQPFSEVSCPNLHHLEGNRASIERLFPSRKVESLFWVPELGENVGRVDSMGHLASEFGNLRTLSYGAYFRRPPLSLIVDYLISLERLELVGLYFDELNLDLDDVMKIINLRELVISFSHSSRRLPVPVDGRAEMVKKMFDKLLLLETVDVACEWVMIDEWVYQRWERGCDMPTMIKEDPVRSGRFRVNWGG